MTPLRIGAPRLTLIVAPHPDDEAIGAFELIRRLRLRGRQVRIVVVTDGAASHPGSARWPRAKLIAARRRETQMAMRRLGVTARDISFLGLPDGKLTPGDRRQAAAIVDFVRRCSQLDLLVGPASNDAHPDHRAVAAALAGARIYGARRLSYPVWAQQRSRAHLRRGLALNSALLAKRTAIRRYRTQTGAITDDPSGFAMSASEQRRFSRPIERFEEAVGCARSR